MELSIAKDRYRRVKFLARGSFGRAFKAERVQEGDTVVVKEIHLNEICNSRPSEKQKQNYREMAYREFKVMQKLLPHPNIIDAIAIYSEGDFIHLVMEYCDSESMLDAIQSRYGKLFPESHIWMWAAQLARVLEHLHNNNVLHRDVKADNIFIKFGIFLKLGDFGLVKEIEQINQVAFTGWGTPTHNAPEVIKGNGFDCKSEVWSFGVVFHHLATLCLPFDSDHWDILIKTIQFDEPLPSISTSHYSPQLRKLAEQLLEKDSKRRPSFSEIMQHPKIKEALGELKKHAHGISSTHDCLAVDLPNNERSQTTNRPVSGIGTTLKYENKPNQTKASKKQMANDIKSRPSFDLEKNRQLLKAAENGDSRTVEVLIVGGRADVETKDESFVSFGWTPLMWAANNGHAKCVELLLKQGNANVETKSVNGNTALLLAAASGRVEAVRILLEHICTNCSEMKNEIIGAGDVSGKTALMLAAKGGHIDIVKLLLKAGASAEAKANDGTTALKVAKDAEVIAILRRNTSAR